MYGAICSRLWKSVWVYEGIRVWVKSPGSDVYTHTLTHTQLSQHVMYHLPMHIRQSITPSLVFKGQAFMINP